MLWMPQKRMLGSGYPKGMTVEDQGAIVSRKSGHVPLGRIEVVDMEKVSSLIG